LRARCRHTGRTGVVSMRRVGMAAAAAALAHVGWRMKVKAGQTSGGRRRRNLRRRGETRAADATAEGRYDECTTAVGGMMDTVCDVCRSSSSGSTVRRGSLPILAEPRARARPFPLPTHCSAAPLSAADGLNEPSSVRTLPGRGW
jgi:hypothetical protein